MKLVWDKLKLEHSALQTLINYVLFNRLPGGVPFIILAVASFPIITAKRFSLPKYNL